jgi:hypothetical protein
MSNERSSLPRRSFVGGLAASAGVAASAPLSGALAQTYPPPDQRGHSTGQVAAPSASRAVRRSLGTDKKTQFEYRFPGVRADRLRVVRQRRPRDGTISVWQYGRELIAVVQKPDELFPRDFICFSQMEVDDSCIYVNRNAVRRSKMWWRQRRAHLNVAVSRIPTHRPDRRCHSRRCRLALQPHPLWRRQPDLHCRAQRRGRRRRRPDGRRHDADRKIKILASQPQA